MDYDDDDELKYLGGLAPPPLPPPPSTTTSSLQPKNLFFQDEEEEEEEDAISRSERTTAAKPRAKRTLVFEDDDAAEKDLNASDFYAGGGGGALNSRRLNDDEITKNPIMEQMEFLIPIDRAASGSEIVPYKAQAAAETLLFYASANGGNEIALPEAVLGPLRLLVNRVDEFTQVDPLVVISATLRLPESCAVYLEETLPVSRYLLARALNVSFEVAITPKRRVKGVTLDNNEELEVSVRPYKGRDDRKRGDTFHLRELVEQSERMDDNKWVQIQAYMITLGQLPPRRVCDFAFIDEQMENFKKILGGQLKVVRPHKKKK